MSARKLITPLQDTHRNKYCSQFMPENCEYAWKVSFEDTEDENVIYSAPFQRDSNAHFKWLVEFHPRHNFEFRVNCVLPLSPFSSIFLSLVNKKIRDLDIFAECCFFIKTEAGSTIISKKGELLRRELWGNYLFYDWFELLSKIGQVPIIVGVRISARYNNNAHLVGNFLRKNGEFVSKDGTSYDVVLRTKRDGKEFKVHGFLLASRSKVFAAMFSNEMKEKLTGVVEIQEFSGYIMGYVLNFIYNGIVYFNDFNFAMHLLEAAEYFELRDLKSLCAAFLLECIDAEQAWQILLSAHLYCLQDLKAITLEFIKEHKRALCARANYREFPKDLLIEIIKAFSKRKFSSF